MLAAKQRLRRREDFAAAVRAGRRAGSGSLVVHLVLSVDTDQETDFPARTAFPVRAGFVVPKAVGGAVVRNKVRRRLRHLVRDRLASLPAGSELVVRAGAGASARSYDELGVDLDLALAAAKVRKARRAGLQHGGRRS